MAYDKVHYTVSDVLGKMVGGHAIVCHGKMHDTKFGVLVNYITCTCG
jgi:hypothetical protein